ncbi:SRPBCC domain-containing protein [Roseinatronobacter alkalisoli]|uniref:SRPBCC domain-containing protein n=1 Tax=Roseinatronobacter alkalisoli TaxID=3028235 RepID=A0ABT5T7Q1_9RHOB|nr:SRPBCC domain-containing protein [Roseinatronobacter sp. HJB301]MDD7971001.1 SRPBCC domain-containing protein [Roseinatronobacter sp. HJB301]
MTMLFVAVVAVLIGFCAALAFAPRDGFETGVTINAPPDLVWALLTDPVAHVAWNPIMHAVAGQFVQGARLRLTMRTPSGGKMTFRPHVLVADPGRELRWLGRLAFPRLFDGQHYFRLIAEDGGTRLIHGECFRGVLLWVMDVQQFRPAFDAVNAGLKAHAELAHSEERALPDSDRVTNTP